MTDRISPPGFPNSAGAVGRLTVRGALPVVGSALVWLVVAGSGLVGLHASS